MEEESVFIGPLEFRESSVVCPEQYDIINSFGEYLGYVRLRFGELTARNADGAICFSHNFERAFMGCFDSDEQRDEYLEKIAAVFRQGRG